MRQALPSDKDMRFRTERPQAQDLRVSVLALRGPTAEVSLVLGEQRRELGLVKGLVPLLLRGDVGKHGQLFLQRYVAEVCANGEVGGEHGIGGVAVGPLFFLGAAVRHNLVERVEHRIGHVPRLRHDVQALFLGVRVVEDTALEQLAHHAAE